MAKTPPQPVESFRSPRLPRGQAGNFRPLLQQYDWDVTIALAVMQAESGCRPNATNQNTDGSNDAGLFQINSIHVQSGLVGDAARFNPQQNIKAAYAIYQGDGWHAWASYNSGSYLKHL